jgi:hypothetical protein
MDDHVFFVSEDHVAFVSHVGRAFLIGLKRPSSGAGRIYKIKRGAARAQIRPAASFAQSICDGVGCLDFFAEAFRFNFVLCESYPSPRVANLGDIARSRAAGARRPRRG